MAIILSCEVGLIILTFPTINNALISVLEGKSYAPQTLETIRKHRKTILYYAARYNISRYALAGALADEVNRSIYHKKHLDYLQEQYIRLLPEAYLKHQYALNWPTIYLDVTKHDVGLGSINIRTALIIWQTYPAEFKILLQRKRLFNIYYPMPGIFTWPP